MNIVQRLLFGLAGTGILTIGGVTTLSGLATDNPSTVSTIVQTTDTTTATVSEATESDDTSDDAITPVVDAVDPTSDKPDS